MEHMDIFNTKPYTGTNEQTKVQKKEKTNEQKPSKTFFNINDYPELKERWYKVFYSIFKCTGAKKPNLDKETFAKVAFSFNQWIYSLQPDLFNSYIDCPILCCNKLATDICEIIQINLDTYPASKHQSLFLKCKDLLEDPASKELFLSVSKDYKAAIREFYKNQNHLV